MNNRQYPVYVVVMRTETNVAKVIRFFIKMTYSHAALASEASVQELYSFSRIYTAFPLPSSFKVEKIGEGLLGKHAYIPCEIHEIRLDKKRFHQFQQLISHFQSSHRQYSYSILGLFRVHRQIESELHHKFVCSQFVAYVLHSCGVQLQKPACLYSPEDLRYLPEARLVYRGDLNRYFHEKNEKKYLPLLHSFS